MHPIRVLKRAPVRLKLTLAFAGVMAVLLAGVGLFLYFHFRTGLDDGINQGLQARASDVATLARQPGTPPLGGRDPLSERGASFAEILAPDGRVLDASPQLAGRALLSRREFALARRSTVILERGERARLLARPVAGSRPRVVVVGVSLAQRERALETLGGALLIGGSLALLLASAAGYALAFRALSPVESMRARAEAIPAADPDARLPVPEARDELQRLALTLNAMLGRLDVAFARERAFVADASHELRTPLSLLKLELELALRDRGSATELEAAIRSGAEEVDRLVKLAEDLLVIARADQGGLPVRKAPITIRETLQRVADRFAASSNGERRQIAVHASDALRVDADAQRLEQALANLVDNALRHGAGTVTVSATRQNGSLELHVTDEGAGFPPGLLTTAFERFSRADRARARGGTGLGLAIVEAIARAHSGSVGATNRPTGGADVWLTLPEAAR